MHQLSKAATSVELRIPLCPQQDASKTPKREELVTRSGFPRLRCCVCHLYHERAISAPAAVRQFFKTVLQQVRHFKVDVNAGDANAAAYKYYRNQGYQHLHNSSVAIMPREMQREVNMGHPFESVFHMHYSTNNHPPQLHSADDFDCCFTAFLSW